MRLRAVRADAVRPGDILWSSASQRELGVVSVEWEAVRADGDLLAGLRTAAVSDADDPASPELTHALVFVVLDGAGARQRLGAFAPHARIQLVRRAAHKTGARRLGELERQAARN